MSNFSINSISNSSVSRHSSNRSSNHDDINKKLKSLGIPADVVAQGPAAVKAYADANNIDLSSIQPPSKNDSDSTSSVSTTSSSTSSTDSGKHVGKNKSEIESELKALGVPADVVAKGPAAVKEYADANSIDLSKLQPPKHHTGSKLNFQA